MKKKSNFSQKMASPEQIYFVHKNGIFVYPISEFELTKRKGRADYNVTQYKRWYIEADNNGNKTVFKKRISTDDLNDSIAKTIIYYYNKLKEKK